MFGMDSKQKFADLKIISSAQRKALARGDKLPEWTREWLSMADLALDEFEQLEALRQAFEKKERTVSQIFEMLLTCTPAIDEDSPLN